jgi:hypothetical protein
MLSFEIPAIRPQWIPLFESWAMIRFAPSVGGLTTTIYASGKGHRIAR